MRGRRAEKRNSQMPKAKKTIEAKIASEGPFFIGPDRLTAGVAGVMGFTDTRASFSSYQGSFARRIPKPGSIHSAHIARPFNETICMARACARTGNSEARHAEASNRVL